MITYIVKVTNNCNLICNYCYYCKENIGKQSIDLHLIEKLFNEACDIDPIINIIWHGGEPLLVGSGFFIDILSLQNNISQKRDKKFINSIQTNATLINNEWIDIFMNGNFKIGISLDGPELIHNQNRKYNKNTGSYKDVLSGIEKLRSRGIKFSCLSVVSKVSLGREVDIFKYMVENNIYCFDFLPYIEFPTSSSDNDYYHPLEPGDYSTFINNIFDLWFRVDNPDIRIRFLEEVLAAILFQGQKLCTISCNCRKYITITPNGDIFPCDNYVGDQNYIFGNLNETGLCDILYGTKRKNYFDKSIKIRSECYECEYYNWCLGGCNYYVYPNNSLAHSKSLLCFDYKRIFQHVSSVVFKEHPKIKISR